MTIIAETPLGTYSSGASMVDVSAADVEEVRRLMSQINNLEHLSITNGTETYYIPQGVLQQSVVTLRVEDAITQPVLPIDGV